MKKNYNKTVIFNPQKMLLSDKSAFSVKEAYKTLRTNVMFSLPGKESKCIGVVSPDRGDGKPLIRRSSEYGIDIMAAGDIPPDPTALLGSKQMDAFIELLKKYYDYIILDFPPATIVSDAASMSRIVDGYLIVIRHNESEFSKINETLRQMQFADAKILGFVYNGKEENKKYYRKGKYSKYYYNYYYYKKGE